MPLVMAYPISRGHVTNLSRKLLIDLIQLKHASKGCSRWLGHSFQGKSHLSIDELLISMLTNNISHRTTIAKDIGHTMQHKMTTQKSDISNLGHRPDPIVKFYLASELDLKSVYQYCFVLDGSPLLCRLP